MYNKYLYSKLFKPQMYNDCLFFPFKSADLKLTLINSESLKKNRPYGRKSTAGSTK